MQVEEALQIITGVCSDYKGTLKDHQTLQQALETIKDCLKKKEQDDKENKTSKKKAQA